MIYKNDKWKDEKHYQIIPRFNGGFILREYNKGIKKTEIDLTASDKHKFEKLLKENDWYEFIRS